MLIEWLETHNNKNESVDEYLSITAHNTNCFLICFRSLQFWPALTLYAIKSLFNEFYVFSTCKN